MSSAAPLASDRHSLLLATRSADKAREIQEILGEKTRVITLREAGLPVSPEEDDIEAFETFHENALAKARHFHALTGLPTLADDSGICADALDGRPGVRSKRFSGNANLEGSELDRANNDALIEALDGRAGDERAVHYVCAAVHVDGSKTWTCAIGAVRGSLLTAPRGEGGFGYDPLFLLPGIGLTFGEIDAPLKHRYSHRGRAFRALAIALHRA